MLYKMVIFDLDGTLTDSSPGIVKGFVKALDEAGYPQIPEDEIKSYIGPPIQYCARDRFGLTDDETEAFNTVFRRIYYGEFLYDAVPYPGVESALEELSGRYDLAVATNKEVSNSCRMLAHFGLDRYFKAVKGHNNVKGYVKTDMIRELLDEFGLSPDEALMVGDSRNDAISAEANGVDFVGLLSGFGFGSESDVGPYPHVAVLPSAAELTDII